MFHPNKTSVGIFTSAALLAGMVGCSTPSQQVADTSGQPESQSSEPMKAKYKIGQSVKLAGWTLKVTKVNIHANKILMKSNMFNDKPKKGYVLVTYKATYTGSEKKGDTSTDLSWSLGTTNRVDHDPALAVTPADTQEWPTEARKGGTVKGQVAFDLPASKVKGGILSVEELSGNGMSDAEFSIPAK